MSRILRWLPCGITILLTVNAVAMADDPDEISPDQNARVSLKTEVRKLHAEIDKINKRLTTIEGLLKTSLSRSNATRRRKKSVPRRFFERLSKDSAERYAIAIQAATQPLHQWTLSDQWTVWGVTVADDNRTILAGGAMGEWRLCDLETGQLHLALEHPKLQQILSVAVSPDGSTLALGAVDGLHLLSRDDTSNERFHPFARSVNTIDFSRDGKFVAIGGGVPTVQVLRVADLSVADDLKTGAGIVKRIRFSDDGQRIAVSGGHYGNRGPNTDRREGETESGIWDLATHAQIFGIPDDERGSATHVEEVIPGQMLFLSSPSHAATWSLIEAKPIKDFAPRGNRIVDISRDKSVLMLALDDDRVGLFDIESGQMQQSLQIPHYWRHCACLSPDGQSVVTGGSDGGIRAWRLK